MKNVLITGASGFIGYHLVKRLSEQNAKIYCLVRSTSDIEHLKPFDVDFRFGDVTNDDCLRVLPDHIDCVFHIAGRIAANRYSDFYNTNCIGLKRIASFYASRAVPPIFLHVSSLAVMGPSKHNIPKTEKDYPKPYSRYGKSKWEAEKTLVTFASQMPCTIIRPAIVFGEADKMNLELFRTVSKIGLCPIPGWTDKSYSWIHVEDLVDLFLAAAKFGERLHPESVTKGSEFFGEGVYLASAERGTKFSALGQMIGHSLGKKTWGIQCPYVMVWTVSTYYEIKKRLTGKMQAFDWDKAFESLKNWTCSSEKAQNQLQFQTTKTLDDRIQQTADWYRQKGWLR